MTKQPDLNALTRNALNDIERAEAAHNALLQQVLTCRWLLENRAAIAWARLPTAVLLPESLATEQVALRQSGVMAALFAKSLQPDLLVDHIRRSRAF